MRSEVRSLLCLLTKDSRRGTEEMNNIIMTRIASAVKGHLSNPYLVRLIPFWLIVLLFSQVAKSLSMCTWKSVHACKRFAFHSPS